MRRDGPALPPEPAGRLEGREALYRFPAREVDVALAAAGREEPAR